MDVWIFKEPILEMLGEAKSQVGNQSILTCRQRAATFDTSILYGFVFFIGYALPQRTHVCSRQNVRQQSKRLSDEFT